MLAAMKKTNAVFAGQGTTIFEVFSKLSAEHRSINLGQGFPDGNGPADVRKVAAEALEDRPNQYPPMLGVPELRRHLAGETTLDEAIAAAQKTTRNYAKRQLTWFRHQLTGAMVYEARFSGDLARHIVAETGRFLLTES